MASTTPSTATSPSALTTLAVSLVARQTRIHEYEKPKPGGGASSGAANASDDARKLVEMAHTELCKAAKQLAHQASAFYMIAGDGPANAEGCAKDLEKLVEVYDSWVGQLLTNALPIVRKAAAKECAKVLEALGVLLKKASAGEALASDAGRVQEAADALPKLETSGVAIAHKLLHDQVRLCADVEEELKESIEESKAHTQEEEEEDEDEEDMGGAGEMVSELLKTSELAAALQGLVSGARLSLLMAADEGTTPATDAALNMLITCAKAASTCIDATVASAYEDDADALGKHAQSLLKVLKKLHDVLKERCGLKDNERRAKLEADLDSAAATLVGACTTAAAEDGVAALSVS